MKEKTKQPQQPQSSAQKPGQKPQPQQAPQKPKSR